MPAASHLSLQSNATAGATTQFILRHCTAWRSQHNGGGACLIVAWPVVLAPAHLYLSSRSYWVTLPLQHLSQHLFLSDGPPKAQNAHSCLVTAQLGDWVQSRTGKTPCPYTPTPPTIPKCASINPRIHLENACRRPREILLVAVSQCLANFQSQALLAWEPFAELLNCRHFISWLTT